MTEPDPHTLVLSRRAMREPAGRATAVPAAVTDHGRMRRDRTRISANPIPLRRARTQTTARAPAANAVELDAASSPTAMVSTPIWDAVTRRRTLVEVTESSTPVWDAVSRRSAPRPAAEAVIEVPAPAVRRTDEGTEQIPAFVMPDAAAALNGHDVVTAAAAPRIFRAPAPAPEPAPLEPLAAAVAAASPHARHARRRTLSWAPVRVAAAAVTAAAFVFSGSVAVTAAVTGTPVSAIAEKVVAAASAAASIDPPAPALPTPQPPPATGVAAPAPQATAVPASVDPCTTPAATTALQAGDDVGAIAALGGADAFRAAVATGAATCVNLADPARLWVVADKVRPLDPIDFAPAALSSPDGVRSLENGQLRADASTAMSALVAAAAREGVGEVAVQSAYRSYDTQVSSYANHVSDRGVTGADQVSARPGYSEHQSGLAADVVACAGDCGTLDDLAATSQGQWVAAHAWEYGWIVRYEDGHTGVTGYSPEPWHLRYIGVDLATAYHDGGWHTLEEFFGLPAAPDYAD